MLLENLMNLIIFLDLPSFNNIIELSNNKIMNPYNSSYCDSFFSFLSSKLLNEYNFLNGIDFYGSFIGIKENFTFDISEELDSLDESEFFMSKLNSEFNILNTEIHNKLINETKKNKIKLKINNNIDLDIHELSIDETDKDIKKENTDQNVHNKTSDSNIKMLEISHEFKFKDFSNNETNKFFNKKSSHDSKSSTTSRESCNNSSCSSRFSMTDDESNYEDEDEDEDEESETSDED